MARTPAVLRRSNAQQSGVVPNLGSPVGPDWRLLGDGGPTLGHRYNDPNNDANQAGSHEQALSVAQESVRAFGSAIRGSNLSYLSRRNVIDLLNQGRAEDKLKRLTAFRLPEADPMPTMKNGKPDIGALMKKATGPGGSLAPKDSTHLDSLRDDADVPMLDPLLLHTTVKRTDLEGENVFEIDTQFAEAFDAYVVKINDPAKKINSAMVAEKRQPATDKFGIPKKYGSPD